MSTKTKLWIIALALITLVLSACAPEPSPEAIDRAVATRMAQMGSVQTLAPADPCAPNCSQPAGAAVAVAPAVTAAPSTGAGMAPQDEMEAAAALGVSGEDALFLTVLYARPGDPTAIGWVLGTSSSEGISKVLTASHVPAGVCVDFDPGASTLTGSTAWMVDFLPVWRRALLTSVGQFTGLKATFYWTPCQATANGIAGTLVESSSMPAAAQPQPEPTAQPASCPKFTGVQTTALPDGGCKYTGLVVTDEVPAGYSAHYWDGSKTVDAPSGTTITTGEATFYPNK